MSEGLSQCSVTSNAQHRQEAEVVAAEERERAAVETAATAARTTRLAMAELTSARAEVEALVADAARAAVAELEAPRASSNGSSVSADDDRVNELKLVREAAREQAAQWQLRNPRGTVAVAQTGADAPATLRAEARAAAVPPTVAAAQTGADAPAAGLMEIVAFTGGTALPPRTGTMVTMGSSPLSGTLVPAAGGLPSPRPTTLSGLR
jgi:hypothetical protein